MEILPENIFRYLTFYNNSLSVMYDKVLNPGRIIYATGMMILGVFCIVFMDFIVGRPPAWPFDARVLGFFTGAGVIAAAVAIATRRNGALAALSIAAMVLLLSFLRHLPKFMVDWGNAYKTLALLGGAIILAVYFLKENNQLIGNLRVGTKTISILLFIGTALVSSFFIAAGYAHYKFAGFVEMLIPEYIPFRQFWTYFTCVCLIAGGLGILIPPTRKLAALLSGVMVLGWFLLLHIPRFLADPNNASDRLGLIESFTFVGIFFVMAGLFSKK
jgi:uncharacterized membrane protein YphA (DoxX/SURF4 family)